MDIKHIITSSIQAITAVAAINKVIKETSNKKDTIKVEENEYLDEISINLIKNYNNEIIFSKIKGIKTPTDRKYLYLKLEEKLNYEIYSRKNTF